MDLKALYQKKILNQELSLREFTAKKTVLESRPSKAQVRIGAQGGKTMHPGLFDLVAQEVFDRAYFVALLGVDDCFATDRWKPILRTLERCPAVNWHTSTFLWLDKEEAWERLAGLGMFFGIVVQGATKNAWDAVCDWDLGFSGFVKNVATLSRVQARAGRGMVYLIAQLHAASANEMEAYVRLALDHGISEVRFSMGPSLGEGELNRDSLVKALELAARNGVSVLLADQRLLNLAEPELLMQVSKSPARKANFPPDGCRDPAFDGLHAWQPLDAKVLDRTRVAVYQKCFKPFHFVSIDLEGRVGPCSFLTEPFTALGDLRTQSFRNIWNGQGFQDLRKTLLEGKPEDPRCKWCFAHRLSD